MNVQRWMAAAALVALTACGGEEGDADRRPLGEPAEEVGARSEWPEGLGAAVDEANLAYSARDYDKAAEIYGRLSQEHPEIGTVWFGLYMAEQARGNQEAAAAALEKANQLTPGLGGSHDVMMDSMRSLRGTGEMPAGELPAEHPPIQP